MFPCPLKSCLMLEAKKMLKVVTPFDPILSGMQCSAEPCEAAACKSVYDTPPPFFRNDTFSTATFSLPSASFCSWYTYSTSTSPWTYAAVSRLFHMPHWLPKGQRIEGFNSHP
jgi:hypothetical protein